MMYPYICVVLAGLLVGGILSWTAQYIRRRRPKAPLVTFHRLDDGQLLITGYPVAAAAGDIIKVRDTENPKYTLRWLVERAEYVDGTVIAYQVRYIDHC